MFEHRILTSWSETVLDIKNTRSILLPSQVQKLQYRQIKGVSAPESAPNVVVVVLSRTLQLPRIYIAPHPVQMRRAAKQVARYAFNAVRTMSHPFLTFSRGSKSAVRRSRASYSNYTVCL